jgi:hypothetical protein
MNVLNYGLFIQDTSLTIRQKVLLDLRRVRQFSRLVRVDTDISKALPPSKIKRFVKTTLGNE